MTISSDSPLTRRRLLAAAATATAFQALPPALREAVAAPPPSRQPSLRDVEHVVLLMQENRSFDHYFGTMPGVTGFSDPDALMLPSGLNVFHQPTDRHADGFLLPFHLDTRRTSALRIPSTGHGWEVLHAAWNGGAMDSWLAAHYRLDGNKDNVPLSMGYYEEADIPFHRALAAAFTICDRYHCSMMASTAPNRLYWETGTIDPHGLASGPILSNEATVRTWRTYAENLTEAGISWKCYHVPDGMESSLKYFKAFRDAPATSPLRRGLMEGPIDQFEQDIRADRLPRVSWLFAPRPQNEHPAQSTPAAGARFIARKVEALAAHPEVWAKTAFILAYDENDGLFDHIRPPTPPPGTPDEFVTLTSPSGVRGEGMPVGAGFRVPCIIVSPWTVGGWVCSDLFDHTSQLRFLEAVTGVAAPNISGWRRKTFGDLTSAFRFRQKAALAPRLPNLAFRLTSAEHAVATLPPPSAPASDQVAPGQERSRGEPASRARPPDVRAVVDK
ncbi:alkaline phosphatase family protein [Sphingomonas sp. MMS24-J13]|uniref:alkaline phosphatase family protein n=1 Tax=Sphingomonas sp. MMS24-J13 TaxID=3238686 RepID=UPI00384F1425